MSDTRNRITSDGTPTTQLLKSLRQSNYTPTSAMDELIDNSKDAGATFVNINGSVVDGDFLFTVADNGKGMSGVELLDALRLGSSGVRDQCDALGCFGLGMKTGIMSFAKRFTVITKSATDAMRSTTFDFDTKIEQNSWHDEVEDATSEQAALFLAHVGDHATGTLIVIDHCDKFKYTVLPNFWRDLSTKVARVYRKPLRLGFALNINGVAISPRSPLYLYDVDGKVYNDTKIVYDNVVDVNTSIGKVTLNIRMAHVPYLNIGLNAKAQRVESASGFYIMRNDREIADGLTLGMFKRDSSLAGLRCEIYFTATPENDNLFNIAFNKSSSSINDDVFFENLRRILKAPMASVIEHESEGSAGRQNAKLNDIDAAVIKELNSYASNTTKLKPERVGDELPYTAVNKHPRLAGKKTKGENAEPRQRSLVDIKYEAMGVDGPMYTHSHNKQSGVLLIVWNTSSLFYQQRYAPGDVNTRTGIMTMLYGFVRGYYIVKTDNNNDTLLHLEERAQESVAIFTHFNL